MTTKPKAIGLREAAERVGISYSTARHKVAEGTFPIPALPRRGLGWHKFSEYEIENYLRNGATEDAR